MQKFWKDYWGTDLKIAILRIDANFYDGHQDCGTESKNAGTLRSPKPNLLGVNRE